MIVNIWYTAIPYRFEQAACRNSSENVATEKFCFHNREWVCSVCNANSNCNLSQSCVVCNHVRLGVSLRVPHCVVDAGYELGRSLGDCKPALPNGRKYQMVKTQFFFTSVTELRHDFTSLLCLINDCKYLVHCNPIQVWTGGMQKF